MGPGARDGRQAPAVGVVPAEGADAEQRPQPGRCQLDPGAGLDVAGQQAHDDVGAGAQGAHDLGHAWQDPHAAAVTDDGLKLAGVRLEAVREPGRDARLGHAGAAQEVPDDPEIGRAPEVVVVDRPGQAVDAHEGAGQRLPAGAPRRHQRAVDVEQDETPGCGHGISGARGMAIHSTR